MNQYTLPQRLLTESIATFCLVLIGCGAMEVNARANDLTHVGVATVWGLIVMVMIYATGRISGAHMNPAVTIALAALGKMKPIDTVGYVVVQLIGATVAALALELALGGQLVSLGATTTKLTMAQGFAIEFMMTAILMFVVMGVSTGAKEESVTAGLAVGATIAMEAFVAGPLTKASMNPARSFGPAVLADDAAPASQLWMYIAAPILGALVGAVLYKLLEPKELIGSEADDHASDSE